MKMIKIVVVAIGLIACVGCLSKPVCMLTATDPVEQGKYTVLGSEVSGTDTQVMICGMTFGVSGSSTRRATEKALEQAPGSDGLVRVTVECEEFYFPFNFIIAPLGVVTARVTGTPIKINQN